MIDRRAFCAGLLMAASAGLASALVPTRRMAEGESRLDLERAVPREFGDWKIDPAMLPIGVSPDVQAQLDKIYTQTLSRTYVNSRGERIMLSIAYGADQRGDMQVHKPEVCYPAQGFQVLSNQPGTLTTAYGAIPVKRLETHAGLRWEPVTYWMTVGDRVITGSLERKLTALKHGLGGTVPDGLLFRVSSLERLSSAGFSAQTLFVQQLLGSVDAATRIRIAGLSGR
jgi:EpsI family protein